MIIAAIFVFLAAFLLGTGQIFNTHDWGDDFAQYIMQARALTAGTTRAFAEANAFTIENSPPETGVTVAPWGYPLLLAPVYALFGVNITAFKIVQALLLGLCAAVFFLLLRGECKPWLALTAGLCFAMDQALLWYANYIQSEPYYLLLVLLAMLLVARMRDDGRNRARMAGFGVTGALAYLCRAQGAFLFLSLLIVQVVSRLAGERGQNASFRLLPRASGKTGFDRRLQDVIPYVILLVAFFGVRLLPQNDRPTLYFLEHVTPATVWRNVCSYAFLLKAYLPFPDQIATAAYCVLSALAVTGVIAARDKQLFPLVYGALIFVSNLFFPWAQGARYLLSVFPVFLLYVCYGVSFLLSKVRLPKALIAIGCAAALTAFAFRSVPKTAENLALHRVYDRGAYSTDARATYDYIRDHTDADAVIAFFKPRALALETGRRCFRNTADARELKKADYLLITTEYGYGDNLDWDAMAKSIAAYNGGEGSLTLDAVYENARFVLYRLAFAAAPSS